MVPLRVFVCSDCDPCSASPLPSSPHPTKAGSTVYIFQIDSVPDLMENKSDPVLLHKGTSTTSSVIKPHEALSLVRNRYDIFVSLGLHVHSKIKNRQECAGNFDHLKPVCNSSRSMPWAFVIRFFNKAEDKLVRLKKFGDLVLQCKRGFSGLTSQSEFLGMLENTKLSCSAYAFVVKI